MFAQNFLKPFFKQLKKPIVRIQFMTWGNKNRVIYTTCIADEAVKIDFYTTCIVDWII